MKPTHIIAAACLASATLLGTTTPAAAAAPPEHFTFPIEDSFSFDDCGFVVDFTTAGTLQITLWRNDASLVVRERDKLLQHATFTNAETGKSVKSVQSENSVWDYGTGAVLGSSVNITLTGMGGRLPGTGPSAGRIKLTGTVVDFDPDGVPLVDIPEQEPSFIAGRHPDQDFCAALS